MQVPWLDEAKTHSSGPEDTKLERLLTKTAGKTVASHAQEDGETYKVRRAVSCPDKI